MTTFYFTHTNLHAHTNTTDRQTHVLSLSLSGIFSVAFCLSVFLYLHETHTLQVYANASITHRSRVVAEVKANSNVVREVIVESVVKPKEMTEAATCWGTPPRCHAHVPFLVQSMQRDE